MRLNQLTFTRFIAAFAVLIYHFGLSTKPFNIYVLNQIFKKGNLAVSYFFILSGFVMIVAYGTKKGNIKKGVYYVNRVARIYPAYASALLLQVAVSAILAHTHIYVDAFIMDLMALQAWSTHYIFTLNPVAWSLSVEFLFYFSFPFLFNYLYSKVDIKTVVYVVLSVYVVTQFFLNYYPPNEASFSYLTHFPLVRLNQFMVGNLIGLVFLRSTKKNYDILLTLAAAAILVILYFDLAYYWQDALLTACFACFILLLALNTGKITRLFCGRPWIILGEISYSLYILQFPVYTITAMFFKHFKISEPVTILTIYLVVMMGASYLCFLLIETPANRLIKKLYVSIVGNSGRSDN